MKKYILKDMYLYMKKIILSLSLYLALSLSHFTLLNNVKITKHSINQEDDYEYQSKKSKFKHINMGKQQSTLQFTNTSCMRQFDIYTSEYAQLMYYLKAKFSS